MILKIDALDTLFFRDGKPFSMGDDSFAQGIFPPPPSVIYGALRSAYFANDMQEFRKLKLQDTDSSLNIKVNGFAYLVEETFWSNKEVQNQIYYPAPLDLVQTKEEGEQNEAHLSVNFYSKNEEYYSNSTLNSIVAYQEQVEGLENAIVDREKMQEYLNGDTKFTEVKKLSDYISAEHKVGNGLENATRKTEEGKLYQLKMNRFVAWKKDDENNIATKNFSLLIDSTYEVQPNTLLKLGAEGKTVLANEFEKSIVLQVPNPNITAKKDTYFKLYFSSPTIFKINGVIPDFIDAKTLKGTVNEIELELVAAFVGKYIPIGGFDLNKGKPKMMYKAVPAGSVYYFKILADTTPEKITTNFHNQKLSTIGSDEGFGLAYVGLLNPTKNDN